MRGTFVSPGPVGRQVVGRLAALVFAVALVGLAVGPATGSAQDDEPDAPTGAFNITISRADVPKDLAGGPGLIGQWRIEFTDDGTYTMSRLDVGEVVRGSYEVDGATITLLDEGGILACGGPDGETAEATYAWELDGDTLALTPIEDECGARRLLLGTRTLGGFAACEVQPLARDRRDDDPDATPGAGDADLPAIPNLQPATAGRQDAAEVERAIDDLLQQVTGCWATGDPERFLPLHSEEVLDDIADLGPPAEFNAQLAEFMANPLTFERVGDVELEDPTHASAYVVLNFGPEEVPLQFQFVFEDGRWLLDTFFLFELIA